jgi:uncharacterized protein (TIGR02284 family)
MLATKETIDCLNSMLRGEISATETYVQTLEKMASDGTAVELQQIRDDHRTAANDLRQHVHQFGGDPDQGSGTWGMVAKATQGVAKVFGKSAALTALKEGEQQGLAAYENVLKKEDLPMECQTWCAC